MESAIRPSDITKLLDKVKRKNYQKYLYLTRIGHMRGLSDVEIRFDFPVTALIGPNGGGKSTVLGAAACAYKDTKPGNFFPKSSLGDNSMSEWNAEHEMIDRDRGQNGHFVSRKIKFKEQRWVRGNMLTRDLQYFGIGRTVAVSERPEFKKLMKPTYSHAEQIKVFPQEIAKQIEHILGKSIADFRKTNITADGRYTFHIGKNLGQDYSEFHFGAGESSIIRIVSAIENMPDNSLVLIEELENGLHPVATQRLVEYLIMSAIRKSNQVIFTTHSDEALLPLPPEAIWACFNGHVQQGKLSVQALRVISGKSNDVLAIFVEDEFAKIIVGSIVRIFLQDNETISQVKVYALSGDGNAVKVHKNRMLDPTTKHKSICIVDGDSQQKDDPAKGVLRLPGTQPELTVFQDAEKHMDSRLGILTVCLHQATSQQQRVRDIVESVSLTCRDPHLYFAQIAEHLGYMSTDIVQSAFVNLWIQNNKSMFEDIANTIKSFLPEFQEQSQN